MVELKDAVKDQNASIGTEVALKKIRAGQIKTVFIASNCPADAKETLEHYAQLANVEVVNLEFDNRELGIRAKKPYSISVLAL